MSTIYVGLPVWHHSRRFHFDKGPRWNAVEHLLLQAVAVSECSAGDLGVESGLGRRVVLEALIRLMRVGWVELRTGQQGVTFRATERGKSVAVEDELPAVTERKVRRLDFAIDKVTGSVFRRRDLSLIWPGEWDRRTKGQQAILITSPESGPAHLGHVGRLLDALFNNDEQLVRVDGLDRPVSEKIALFTVHGGAVEGLPQRAPSALRGVVLDAASVETKSSTVAEGVTISVKPVDLGERRPVRRTEVRRADLICGGEEHRRYLSRILRNARRYVFIHSTFLAENRFDDLLPDFRTAVARGARVDVLWGQASEDGGTIKSLREANAIKGKLAEAGLGGAIQIHSFTTRSHAKLIVADDGEGKSIASVGSCNWLSSGFESFEASLHLRDPKIVGDVVYELAELARPPDGQLTDLTVQLAELARELHDRPSIPGSSSLRLLMADEHDQPVLRARDTAKSRITVMSHRLGAAAKPAIIIPMSQAAKSRNVDVKLYFGRPTGSVEHQDAADARWSFKDVGVDLVAVYRPRLHAKVLTWDDDNAVITSLNWLSGSTLAAEARQEIGVAIDGRHMATGIREAFELSKDRASQA